ncbi:type II secretion system protein GspM [Thiohalobacter sp.]|uniref:type II secretion system protein GspM n=1 Tax=Thiohalobacter sp. TaxID=2025948 RepID=UPI002628F856|nr:type II secretion system protein GspM [Thiohalobacter sp.]
MKLPARVEGWLERLDALSLRERLIVLGTGLLLAWFLFNSLFIDPALRQLEQRRLEITEWESRLATLEIQTREMAGDGSQAIASREARLQELRAALAARHAELESRLGTLLEPRQAAHLLRDLLRGHRDLRLLALETGDLTPWPADETADPATGFARYDLHLELEGSYLAALDYLAELEALPWRLMWDRFELESTGHPRARIRIDLYTLGMRGGDA